MPACPAAVRAALLAAASLALATVLHSSAAGQLPRLETAGLIGCVLCQGPSAFDAIQALAVAPDGSILVADRSDPIVRIFNPDGTVVLAHGRTGEGPGEHRLAIHVAPLPGGGHETYDMRLRRHTAFDAAGAVVATRNAATFADVATRAPGGALHLAAPDFRTFTSSLLRWPDAGGAHTLLTEARPDPAEASDPARLYVAAAPGGGLAYGYGELAYVIHRLDGAGNPLPPLRRQLPRPRRTPAELEAARERLAAGRARLGAMAAAEGGLPPAAEPGSEESHFSALAHDEQGRLWVLTNRGDLERTVLDVFGRDGSYLGELVVPVGLRQLALGAGLLAGLAVDGNGVERVALWRIQ